jgi:predicted transcriptional regulator
MADDTRDGGRTDAAGGEPAGRRPAGALEAEVLALLLAADRPLSPARVRAGLSAELAYSTVVTVLSRMHDKGVLTRAKHGRSYAYAPAVDTQGLTALRMARVLDRGPDRAAVLARFVGGLPPGDERLLRRLLDIGPAGRDDA